MMSVKELERRIQKLENRLDEMQQIEDSADQKNWLWNADKAQQAADLLIDAFDWHETPYEYEDFWIHVHDTLKKIASED